MTLFDLGFQLEMNFQLSDDETAISAHLAEREAWRAVSDDPASALEYLAGAEAAIDMMTKSMGKVE